MGLPGKAATAAKRQHGCGSRSPSTMAERRYYCQSFTFAEMGCPRTASRDASCLIRLPGEVFLAQVTVYGTFRLSDATKKRAPGPSITSRSPRLQIGGTQKKSVKQLLLHQQRRRSFPRLIPESELYSIPKAEFVVDDAQVILNHVFGGSDCLRDLFIL